MTAVARPLGEPLLAERYRIGEELGRGGMGTVYRAEHVGLRMPVALKHIEIEGEVEELDARFEREARTLARLCHPGCVRFLDYGKTVDGAHYIAMELLEGRTLADELAARGPLDPDEAVAIAREITTALAHAHRQGVLHRDLKPENLMRAERDGRPAWVLIDFGLAQLVDDDPLTAVGQCFGSPSYLAPERLLGRVYDARADLYAVGVLLYEMLAGARPFRGGSARETAKAHIEAPVPPLDRVRPDVPKEVADAVHRALAKHPRDRFESADDMLAALAPAETLRPEPAYAEPAGPVGGEATAALRPESAPARVEEASTTFMCELEEDRPSLLFRLWAWLRYGAWRWRHEVGAAPAE